MIDAVLLLPQVQPWMQCPRLRSILGIWLTIRTALFARTGSRSAAKPGRCPANTFIIQIAYFPGWLNTIRVLSVAMDCRAAFLMAHRLDLHSGPAVPPHTPPHLQHPAAKEAETRVEVLAAEITMVGAVCYLICGHFDLPMRISIHIVVRMLQIQMIMLAAGIRDGPLRKAMVLLGGSAESRKSLQHVACKYWLHGVSPYVVF